MEESLDKLLDYLAGFPAVPPVMFSIEWWNSPQGRLFLTNKSKAPFWGGNHPKNVR